MHQKYIRKVNLPSQGGEGEGGGLLWITLMENAVFA